MTTAPSPERAALEAVLEALDIPHAATVGDDKIRSEVLLLRVTDAVVMLRGVLRDGADVGWCVTYLRDRLARHPAEGYKTWPEHTADLDAAWARRGSSRPSR